nr:zinc finger, CCHC-type [Tanacetum cinerariifolium]
GKEILVESDTPKKKKLQEQNDAQMARELEEQQGREDLRMNEQIARAAEVARIAAEEEIQTMIDWLDKSNETVAKYLQECQQFASDLSLEKKIELISDLVKNHGITIKRAVVRLPDLKLKFLGERGIECIFVGYAKHSKAFRFYVIKPNDSVAINSIVESRDVVFDENRFSSVPRPSQKSMMDSIMGNNTWVLADLPPVSTPMDTSERLMPNNGHVISQLEYSRVIGCLMYAMTCTRTDIAFAV